MTIQGFIKIQSNYNSTLLFAVNQGFQGDLFTQTMPGTLPENTVLKRCEAILYHPGY